MCDGAIMYFAHGVKSFTERFCALLMNVLLKLYHAKNNQNKKMFPLSIFQLNAEKVVPQGLSHTVYNATSFKLRERRKQNTFF